MYLHYLVILKSLVGGSILISFNPLYSVKLVKHILLLIVYSNFVWNYNL